jgi:hypothetical protein
MIVCDSKFTSRSFGTSIPFAKSPPARLPFIHLQPEIRLLFKCSMSQSLRLTHVRLSVEDLQWPKAHDSLPRCFPSLDPGVVSSFILHSPEMATVEHIVHFIRESDPTRGHVSVQSHLLLAQPRTMLRNSPEGDSPEVFPRSTDRPDHPRDPEKGQSLPDFGSFQGYCRSDFGQVDGEQAIEVPRPGLFDENGVNRHSETDKGRYFA